MEHANTAGHGYVVCIKIGMGEQEFFIPIDDLAGVRINPELVKVPDAPGRIVGLSMGKEGPVPYISLESTSLQENEAGWQCGVEIKSKGGQRLGILCTRIEEDVEVEPEILKEQAALPFFGTVGGMER